VQYGGLKERRNVKTVCWLSTEGRALHHDFDQKHTLTREFFFFPTCNKCVKLRKQITHTHCKAKGQMRAQTHIHTHTHTNLFSVLCTQLCINKASFTLKVQSYFHVLYNTHLLHHVQTSNT
jgi:hypothetical protein